MARHGAARLGLAGPGEATRDPARYPGQFFAAVLGLARLGLAGQGMATRHWVR